MNDLMSALQINSFEPLLAAYTAAGVSLGDRLDGGAGAGHTTKRMLVDAEPSDICHAFEPFPGNHPFFPQKNSIRLYKSALSHQAGHAKFIVPQIVKSDSAWGQSGLTGYSSTGGLSAGSSQLKAHANPEMTLSVETVRADQAISSCRRVGFVKLDLQGGEVGALKGMTRLLPEVALMWIEYTGQVGLLKLLDAHNFMFFDTEYLFVGEPAQKHRNTFHISQEDQALSTGKKVWTGYRRQTWPNFLERFMKWRTTGRLMQTDLVCVNKAYLSEFTAALAHLPSPPQRKGDA